LFQYFNQRYSKEAAKSPLQVPKRTMELLTDYSWPGNVRELENFVHRMVIMHDGRLDLDAIPGHMKMTPPDNWKPAATLTLAEAEKQHIERVLAANDYNKTKTALLLGIDRKTLREKLK
jgi:DNA-binding NtrC family response regulator